MQEGWKGSRRGEGGNWGGERDEGEEGIGKKVVQVENMGVWGQREVGVVGKGDSIRWTTTHLYCCVLTGALLRLLLICPQKDEASLILGVVSAIRTLDPDLLVGWEVQKGSLGFLTDRWGKGEGVFWWVVLFVRVCMCGGEGREGYQKHVWFA